MKTATSLALVAIGAILAFAITRSPPFFNLQVAGWVLIATGAAGALIPRSGRGWLPPGPGLQPARRLARTGWVAAQT